jgi:CBS-domain-containing membrane protein
MFVEDVMTAHPVSVRTTTSVKEALWLLDRYSVTILPVVDRAGRVHGVVSEADLIRDRVPRDPRDREDPGTQEPGPAPPPTVAEVYTPHAVTVRSHDDLADAVELLTSTAIKSVPVVDRKGVVVGVLSRSDVVHVLARGDSVIEAGIAEQLAALGYEDWLVDVDEGVVHIDGPSTDHERTLARIAATTATGVAGVRVG